MKLKKLTAVVTTPIAMSAILALASLPSCKPPDYPAKSQGSGLGSEDMRVAADVLIEDLKKNDFEVINGKNFQQILPADTSSSGDEGLVALRDTTAAPPNEFIVGVGPDTLIWHQSHNITGKNAIAEWDRHVLERIDLVKRLANPRKP